MKDYIEDGIEELNCTDKTKSVAKATTVLLPMEKNGVQNVTPKDFRIKFGEASNFFGEIVPAQKFSCLLMFTVSRFF